MTITRTILATALSLIAATQVARADTPAFIAQPSIAGPDDHWDFASWDSEHHRVLVSHGKDVLVIDPAAGSVRSVGAIAGAHAALAIPGTSQILVTSAHDASARVLDAGTGAELARIAVVGDPDATLLSADGHTAYVMGGDSGAISVLDLTGRTETARIQLKPGLEVPVMPRPGLLAVNNEQLSEIELVDLVAGKAVGAIALTGCEGPTGMAYAPEAGLSLSTCANGKAALVDLAARKLLALLPIGAGPDTAIWDAARHRFLVPCGKSGSLSIIRLDGRKPVVEPAVKSEIGTRTGAFDPQTGTLYLPTAKFAAAQAGKPKIVPGSFHVLVLKAAN
ncbi:MAG TPA: gluconolactonase [Novosphingobium sp.]|nr:gluconolactonase [Novosphingobium sp.]